MTESRTRFAPSPTGFLHLGSARTALYNWAFARHVGGSFLLRIEDTDRERSTPELEASIQDGLSWLGLDWDGEPVRQSERAERHADVIEELLASGHAYRCTCSVEELEERKRKTLESGGNWTYDGRCRETGHEADCGPHTVRLRLPAEGAFNWDDQVFGPSGKQAAEIGDAIIRRSDGSPLYHLAVVVDDLDMGITHVIRGADHHRNTALQLALYQALEHAPPQFAHLPLIVTPAGKKLSKRGDSVSVQHFRSDGFVPEAITNWLARIGWSHGDQEVFALDEMRELFDLADVNRASGQADPAKLLWLGQVWIKQLPRQTLFAYAQPFLSEVTGNEVAPDPALLDLLDLLRERSRTLAELASGARFWLVDAIETDEKAARKHLKPEIGPPLSDLAGRLGQLETWDTEHLERAFQATCAAAGDLPLGKLAQPVRVAVTGSAASPGIYDTLRVLGRERSLARIEATLAGLEQP
jgi:glutamyl-tRNA synthetase